jgi:hypothetical protein
MPSGGEELPFDRGVTVQEVGGTGKSMDFPGFCRGEHSKLVPTPEAARGAADLLPVATPVVPRNPTPSPDAEVRQFARFEGAPGCERFPRQNGRNHRSLNPCPTDSLTPMQGLTTIPARCKDESTLM